MFVAGIPLVLVGAVIYKFVSGETFMSGVTHLYGGLYHIPGATSYVCMSECNPTRMQCSIDPVCERC